MKGTPMGNPLQELSELLREVTIEVRNTTFALRALAFAIGNQPSVDRDRLMKDFEAHAFERFPNEAALPDQVLAVMRSLSAARPGSG
jgi:hypothetical protein